MLDTIVNAINNQKKTNDLIINKSVDILLKQLKEQIFEFLKTNEQLILHSLERENYITTLKMPTDIKYNIYFALKQADIDNIQKQIFEETAINVNISNDNIIIILDIII